MDHVNAMGVIVAAVAVEAKQARQDVDSQHFSDERFMSYHARETTRVFPPDFAVRFQDSYMAPWFWLAALKDSLPWVKTRRANRVALTFSGGDNKPERRAKIMPGEVVQAGGLKTRWNYPDLRVYWAKLAATK